jgi:hypothetical protein
MSDSQRIQPMTEYESLRHSRQASSHLKPLLNTPNMDFLIVTMRIRMAGIVIRAMRGDGDCGEDNEGEGDNDEDYGDSEDNDENGESIDLN